MVEMNHVVNYVTGHLHLVSFTFTYVDVYRYRDGDLRANLEKTEGTP